MKKIISQKIIYLIEYHLFFSQLHVSKKCIVPAVTVRKIHGREVVSIVSSLTAYKYNA